MQSADAPNQVISIIIPVCNEEASLKQNLPRYNSLNKDHELVFVDGDSDDETINILAASGFKVIKSQVKSRGHQIGLGAEQNTQKDEILLFLHADTVLPPRFNEEIIKAIQNANWGFFQIKLDSKHIIYKIIGHMMNLRSRLFNIATGDQALFVKKELFLQCVNEVKQHPLMEDIYISKYMKSHHGRAHVIKDHVTTSTRYWQKHGVINTILKMWHFRLLYFFGTAPEKLFQQYYK